MDLPTQPQRYVVGDVINLILDVTHLMNVTQARAVFAHAEVQGVEIVLEGEPEMDHTSLSPSAERTVQRHSFVVMNEEVTVEHVPGVYRFSYVEFETASLRTIRQEETDVSIAELHRKLEIAADPDSLAVSVTLDDVQTRSLDHDDRRVLFEDLEDPDEGEA